MEICLLWVSQAMIADVEFSSIFQSHRKLFPFTSIQFSVCQPQSVRNCIRKFFVYFHRIFNQTKMKSGKREIITSYVSHFLKLFSSRVTQNEEKFRKSSITICCRNLTNFLSSFTHESCKLNSFSTSSSQ